METQLSQECSPEALLDLSTKIAGYEKWKHRLGLSAPEIENIDKNPATFNDISGRFYAALMKWRSKSIDFDNLSNSSATYYRLMEIAKEIKDGNAGRIIREVCVKHTSKLPTAV